MLKNKRSALRIHQSSLVLNVQPVMASRGIQFPLAFLVKAGINNNSAQKILHGKSVQVNYNQLTALCVSLRCTPNDLFALRDMQLPQGHPLQVLPKLDEAPLPNIQAWLAGKSIEEVKALMAQ